MRIATCMLLIATVPPMALAGEHDPADVMDFEVAGAWATAPDLLAEYPEEHLWSTRTIPFAELAGGVKLSAELVKSGEFSARWDNHPRYPTVHATDVPTDWSAAKSVSLWVHSGEATGEIVTLAVLSDDPETHWKDFFLHDFRVDWTGWRQMRVPLADFVEYEKPAGWGKVDGVYFFTRIFDREPNPYTVLHLDAMTLETEDAPRKMERWWPEGPAGRLPVSSTVPKFDAAILNHPWPETPGGEAVEAPIQCGSYFLSERALHGYYPRFQPGTVSFAPDGKPCIRYAGHIIQTLGAEGKWQYRDVLDNVVEPYARQTLGFDALAVNNLGSSDDASVRFDADGDAYMLLFISDPTRDWKSRKGILLHSKDGMNSWQVYLLPNYMARFEKLDGHNPDCLMRPPLILLSRYISPTEIYILAPRKKADGTLEFPEPALIAEGAISLTPHSGEANSALTIGDKVFIAYGKLEILPGKTKEDGAPAYVVTYDLKTGEFSEPVLVGFGGINAEDGHNWPAISVDSEGTLHVLVNGHHDPLVYTRSVRPYDISEWTEPVKFAAGVSYAGLICDSTDTLYSVTRNSHPGYYFRLSLHRKKPGQDWEEPQHLVLPFKPYYAIYYHKLIMDPKTDRLFLSYFARSHNICVFKDELLAFLYIWPHLEKPFMSGKGGPSYPTGSYKSEERKYHFYAPPPGEMTTLVSDDHGDTWHLATTADF